MHFLITGHTGFKGTWLVHLLKSRGHTVSGYSLEQEKNSLFEISGAEALLENHDIGDVRDLNNLEEFASKVNAQIIIHMAAQSLVRKSYREPFITYETNLIGTLNVLRVFRERATTKCILIVTSDKVYENTIPNKIFTELDPLGGTDPYSASKSIADIATKSWTSSFPGATTVIARAGNVIGGGDICQDRLLPELIAQYSAGVVPVLRYPNGVRPWQHVLDCLSGYLLLVQKAALDKSLDGTAWNFGPTIHDHKKVHEVAELVAQSLAPNLSWDLDQSSNPNESEALLLDSTKSITQLLWSTKFNVDEAIQKTVNWHARKDRGESAISLINSDIHDFESNR